MESGTLFQTSLKWFKTNYASFRLFTERDLVWTLQTHILGSISEEALPFRVFNDYPILAGKRRGISADLVILDEDGSIEVAAEFKYEPSHQREDIPRNKLPVVFWADGVVKDVVRVQEFLTLGKVRRAYSVFIDEGGYFRHRSAPQGSRWEDWELTDGRRISALLSPTSTTI